MEMAIESEMERKFFHIRDWLRKMGGRRGNSEQLLGWDWKILPNSTALGIKHGSSKNGFKFSSVSSFSRVRIFATPWTAAHQASLSITNSWSPPKPTSIESVMPSNHFILCCPLLLLSSIFPNIRVFSSESALLIMWPKYWSFSFNIGPSNEHPGLFSFWMEWLDLLAVQETLKSLLQYHSSKASILQCSAFFIVQLSHPYMPTGKTIALTRRTFVGKEMFSFLFIYLFIFFYFFFCHLFFFHLFLLVDG